MLVSGGHGSPTDQRGQHQRGQQGRNGQPGMGHPPAEGGQWGTWWGQRGMGETGAEMPLESPIGRHSHTGWNGQETLASEGHQGFRGAMGGPQSRCGQWGTHQGCKQEKGSLKQSCSCSHSLALLRLSD